MGYRVQGAGFRVQGAGFRVQGLEFGAAGVVFGGQGAGHPRLFMVVSQSQFFIDLVNFWR